MTEAMHSRAQQWIAKQRVEGLSETDRIWLEAHLHSCTACSQRAQETDHALRSLRSAPIPLPSGLASRTQFRVRLRAQQLLEREPRRRVLWLICAMSWALGIASAPYVWQAFAWIGHRTGAPKMLWELGFGLWWMVPAIVAAAVILLENAKQSNVNALADEEK